MCDLGFLCSISDGVLSTPPMDEKQLRLLKKLPARRLRVFLHVGSGHLHLCLSMTIVHSFNTVIMVIIYSLPSLVLYVSSYLYYHNYSDHKLSSLVVMTTDAYSKTRQSGCLRQQRSQDQYPRYSSCYCYYSIYPAQFPRA